ncbi:MAG: hypothetical protein HYZ26_06945 [Chloroflexi bacterium]|nr:hypothetical protein [Chloroflexota bacterium]
MAPTSISGINHLPPSRQREVYNRLIPPEILSDFNLSPFLVDKDGNDLLQIECTQDRNAVELSLFHQHGFEDPVLYGHFADTVNGQIHILLYVMNDPESPRFNVDRTPDGSPTKFGTLQRNLEAESAAMQAGLLPGQVRRGLHRLKDAQVSFENFVTSLGHAMFFVEPLYYHNAIIFERYGFAYQTGRRFMEEINSGFSPDGSLTGALDGGPFRQPEAQHSIRLRSWAIHDGILGQPFDHVTMYRTIGKPARVQTAPGIDW